MPPQPTRPATEPVLTIDAAGALFLEADHGVLAAVEDPAHVDGEEPLEVGGGVLLEGHARGGASGCRRC